MVSRLYILFNMNLLMIMLTQMTCFPYSHIHNIHDHVQSVKMMPEFS